MLSSVFLIASVITISAQAISKKYYIGKLGGAGVYIFNAVFVLSACAFFFVSGGFRFHFSAEVLPYSVSFGVGYCVSLIMGFLAIRRGSLSLTSLISAYSLTIPTLYGMLFLDERGGVFFYVGLALLAASLFLMNMKKGDVKITPMWAIFAFLMFVGNGFCSTVLFVQQRRFVGEYKSEFMIMALAAVAAVLAVISFVKEKRDIVPCIKQGVIPMIICGVSNGVTNTFIMILAMRMNASLMYPLISAGGIILTAAVSRFIYKERLNVGQNVALVLGVCAVVCMNI